MHCRIEIRWIFQKTLVLFTSSCLTVTVSQPTMSTTTRTTRTKRTIVETVAASPPSEHVVAKKGRKTASEVEDEEPDFGIEGMTVPTIKNLLKERDLSTNGDKKTLVKRLHDRMVKEQDPEYEPKRKGRHCKWCDSLMQKRRSLKGDFYGCSTYPECQFTTSLSGHANPKREHLKGLPASGGGGHTMDRLDWAKARYAKEDRAIAKDNRAMKKIDNIC